VIVNLSPADADGLLRLPWRNLAGRTWGLADQLTEERFTCSGDELAKLTRACASPSTAGDTGS
jgi:hypothetical protein